MMPSAYGSWAQWQRRRRKMGYAFTAIAGVPPWLDSAWRDVHVEQADGEIRSTFIAYRDIARDVADRRAG